MGNSKWTKNAGDKDDSGRKFKKRISPLVFDKIEYVDYKDIDLLRKFMSDRAKIKKRNVTGNDTQQQREIARAIKNAREMGLLAYTSAVTTQRKGGRGRDRDGDSRGSRDKPKRDKAPAEDNNNSEAVASKEVASKEVASKEVASKDVASKDVASKDVASKDVASKDVAAEAPVATPAAPVEASAPAESVEE